MTAVVTAISLARTTGVGAEPVPDQTYPSQASAGCAGLSFGPNEWAAQTFTAGVSGNLNRVVLPLGGSLYFPVGSNAPAGILPAQAVVSINRVNANGEPDIGTVLTSTSQTLSNATGDGPSTAFSFSQPVAVVVGTAYAIVVTVTSDSGITWRGDGAGLTGGCQGTYTGGSGFRKVSVPGGTAPAAGGDFFFQTFVDSALPIPPVPPVPAPELRATVVVKPTTGTVLVRRRGTTRFVRLTAGISVRSGSELDTTKGTVRLLSATTREGITQFADFAGGRFVVTQSGDGIVDLRLSGGDFEASCPPARARALSAAQKKSSAPVRKLWGNGKGRFRTTGRYASAAVRGTVWLTADLCDSTVVTVRRGRVMVIDIPKRHRVIVTSGHSYTAVKP
ncbi:MAG: hypothetical protein WCJ67_00085 [Thermoleophilia bacterium]